MTSPEGRRTRYEYGEDGRIAAEVAPSGAKTSFEYDADGNLVKITDPLGHETTKEYDSMDRLIKETNALGDAAEWGYDAAGDLGSHTDPNGKEDTFSYDPLRRLSVASYGVTGLSAESSIVYHYDEENQLTQIVDSVAGEYVLAYDPAGQLESLVSPQGTVGYSYDAAGLREGMTASGQEATSYSYNADDRLTGVSRGSESVSLAYDAAGRPESVTLPDGVEERYGFDAAGEPTSITYQQGKETLGAIDYAYDEDGQLEAEWGGYARMNIPEALSSTTYNAANELVERERSKLSYDKDGNLTADGTDEYAWNARGQLTGISGKTSASFSYDPFGRRVSKTLGGTTTKLLSDQANVIQESVGGSIKANILTGLASDRLFSRRTEAGTQSFLTDRLSNVIGLANSSGKVQTEYTYDPFGTSTTSGASSENSSRFTGRETDGTGLQYNRARYYSPTEDRFISQDPLGFAGSGSNLYGYASGDPIDFRDPSGRSGFPSIPNPFQPLEEWAGGAEEGLKEIGEWVNPAGRYEEVNNTIECILELGVHWHVQGRCEPESGKPGEEGPDPPEPPSTPPPGVPGGDGVFAPAASSSSSSAPPSPEWWRP